MSPSTEPRGLGRRGELLVLIQFVLMIGFALLLLALLGAHHIRDYLTPLPYPVDHSQLVQHGVYGIVRHPLYTSLLSAGLAWIIYNLSLSHLLLWIIGFAFFDYKANKEEHWLSERHPEYADYVQRVRKFVPFVY